MATETLANLRIGVSKEDGKFISGTTTSLAANTTTIVDTALAEYTTDDSRLKEAYALITSGAQDTQERIISSFAAAGTITVRRAFAAAIVSGVTYEVHPFRPSKITEKLNEAIKRSRYLFQVITDDNYSTRANVYRYAVPSTIVGEPRQIWLGKKTFSTEDIDDCDAIWTSGTHGTATLDELDFQEGDGSCKIVTVGAGASEILAYKAISSIDLSEHIGVRFAIKSSIAVAAGDLQLHLSENAAIASPSETLDVPALEADKWEVVTVSYAGAIAGRDAIISVGLYQVTNLADCIIHVDAIETITTLPSETLTDMEKWERLLDWRYDATNHKVYFPYALPENRKLRMIGKGSVRTTDLSAAADTITLSDNYEEKGKQLSYLHARTLFLLYADLEAQEIGAEKAEARSNMGKWMAEAEMRRRMLNVNLPMPTLKVPGWSYYGLTG